MPKLTCLTLLPMVFGMFMPTCAPQVRPTVPSDDAALSELWERPNVGEADLFYGPWGADHGPDPGAAYRLIERKHQGTNPGLTVKDGRNRLWHVKQAPDNDQGEEGRGEVVLSRVLSAMGYHQPPVYFVDRFKLTDASGTRLEAGGRFRLDEESLRERGSWSWQQNPFVGRKPYQGLLVLLLMFNSSDLKNSNNTLYQVTDVSGAAGKWYVVRDLGTALGETGRLAPRRSDVGLFSRLPFITSVDGGFVTFAYHGWHQELVRQRITRSDVVWMSDALSRLTDAQWSDAFRAGGYDSVTANRFIRRLKQKVDEGRHLG